MPGDIAEKMSDYTLRKVVRKDRVCPDQLLKLGRQPDVSTDDSSYQPVDALHGSGLWFCRPPARRRK